MLAEDVPDLDKESKADAHMIGLMFGVKEAKAEDKPEGLTEVSLELRPDGTIDYESIDRRVEMDTALFVDNIPFKRYQLTGSELEKHIETIRERLRL